MKDYKEAIENIMADTTNKVINHAISAYNKGYADGLGKAQTDSYVKGYVDGKADTPFTDTEEAEEKAYNRGLDEVWDVARKIITVDEDVYSFEALREIFGESSIRGIFKHNTATEAITKIKEYEDKQKQDAEIKVGDEVTHDGAKFIVLNIDSQTSVYCLDTRGRTPIFTNIHNLTKTGRHFPQIAEVLKEMRGAENDE